MLAAIAFVLIGGSLALLGAGGSILTVPVLTYAAGLDIHEAAGTSLLIVGLTAAAGAAMRWSAIELSTGLLVASGGILGAGAGAWLNHQVPGVIIGGLFGATLLFAAGAMVLSVDRAGLEEERSRCMRPGLIALYGTAVGAATGFFGVGGGFLVVPMLRLVLKLDVTSAVATSLLVICINSAAGLLGHAWLGAVDWQAGFMFAAIALTGAAMGVPLAARIPEAALTKLFAALLVVVGAAMTASAVTGGAGMAAADSPRTAAAAASRTKLEVVELGTASPVHLHDGLYLSGQPAAADFQEASERGVRTVINFRLPAEVADLGEESIVTGLEMRYENLGFGAPETLTDEIFDRTRAILVDRSVRPALLHCGSANRVGAVWIPYRVLDGGVSFDEALAEARTIGLRTPGYEERAREYIRARCSEERCS